MDELGSTVEGVRSRFEDAVEGLGETLGELLAAMLTFGMYALASLPVLFGLVKFVKWAWYR